MLFFFLINSIHSISSFFFFNDTATTEIYTLSLHDALPISLRSLKPDSEWKQYRLPDSLQIKNLAEPHEDETGRSEEHTSELQSLRHLVCRLLLEKKKKIDRSMIDCIRADYEMNSTNS